MVMRSVPSIVCWESDVHRNLVAVSIVSLIVYVSGVPAITFGTVMYARRKDLLKNDKLMLALGYWYTWYGAYVLMPRVTWQLGQMVRRAMCMQSRTALGGPS